jgi:transposase
MFYGSDAHAQSAAAAFSIIASCRLHSLDPEQYLDEVLRVLPYWPKERYLELAPNSWAATRVKLRFDELDAPPARSPSRRRDSVKSALHGLAGPDRWVW